MPSSLQQAIKFLETQWSSINENKIKGIVSEIRLKEFLINNNHHFVSGGWILTPGNPSISVIPTREKLCILPRGHSFSWNASNQDGGLLTPAEMSAYNYFRQVGLRALFAKPINVEEINFSLPIRSAGIKRANYPRPYQLQLQEVSPNGKFINVSIDEAFEKFPRRKGNIGMRCHASDRIDSAQPIWCVPSIVSDLFWFEYARYFLQVDYLISNNDLDLFIIGHSGSSFPVELKSKTAASDNAFGEWFGIDMGPFAKLSFFTSNAMNNDALYIVEEVDENRAHIEWYGIKFSELVKACSWVGQGGGKGMMGGNSSTYKIPKAAFTPLSELLQIL